MLAQRNDNLYIRTTSLQGQFFNTPEFVLVERFYCSKIIIIIMFVHSQRMMTKSTVTLIVKWLVCGWVCAWVTYQTNSCSEHPVTGGASKGAVRWCDRGVSALPLGPFLLGLIYSALFISLTSLIVQSSPSCPIRSFFLPGWWVNTEVL